MPRPTSKGPTHGPDGREVEQYPPPLASGWIGAGTAFSHCLMSQNIDAYDILDGRAPQRFADILAYEV